MHRCSQDAAARDRALLPVFDAGTLLSLDSVACSADGGPGLVSLLVGLCVWAYDVLWTVRTASLVGGKCRLFGLQKCSPECRFKDFS